MPRLSRCATYVSNYNHVTCRGNDRNVVFRDDKDRHHYLQLLRSIKRKFNFYLFHYVLMDNHVHLSVEIDDVDVFSRCMSRLDHSYSLYYKRKYGHTGHLWEERPYHKSIETDAHLITSGIYIELNPVRAGMVQAPEDWRWSSYNHYAYGADDPLIDDDPVYISLGNNDESRQSAYKTWTEITIITSQSSEKQNNNLSTDDCPF